MGVLTEYVRKEVDHIRAEMARRKELVDEWVASVSKLFETLEGWLKEADSGLGILSTNRFKTPEEVNEPRLGKYRIDYLWVVFGATRQASIVPKARYVSAVIQPSGREPRRADGIVQIKQLSLPEYYLFRWKTDNGDEWFFRNASSWDATPGDNAVEPLDRDRFEAIMLRVLQ